MFMIKFYYWRRRMFNRYYENKDRKLHVKNMTEKFGFVPNIGDEVEDYRGQVHKIIKFPDPNDRDLVAFEDGFACSLWNCCDLPDVYT